MNLKVLFLLLIYYAVISLFFILGGSMLAGYSNPVNLNDSSMTSAEIDTGGLFGTGVTFTRFIGLVTVGIGLPVDTPSGFKVMFSIWSTVILIFTVGFIISSIWDG